VPDELRLVREQAKAASGALVVEVAVRGPSAGVLWPGDVVLEVEGRPLVPEAYETLGTTSAAMRPGGPADVVVWRGGRRERVTVEPRRASTIRPEAAAHHEALGATLFPR
jgi:S1-C subfamily serine protease